MRFLRKVLKWTARVVAAVIVLAFIGLVIAYFRSDNTCAADLAPKGERMKAILTCDYGSPDTLKFADVEKPKPVEDQVLVRVRAAAVNPLDWHYVRGTPYAARFLAMGLRKPGVTRLGVDFAGTVEAVGPKVKDLKPGDDVFGGRTGAFAEYLTVREERPIVRKPPGVTFEQAASIPVAALTALQGLRDKGHIQRGQKVLINGASGGVGTFAVQLAKSFGADVTGVCSGRNVEMVLSLGADKVIDYTKEDFTTRPERYDLILDNVGTRPLLDFKKALTPNGRCVLIGGGGPADNGLLGPMTRPVKAFMLSPFVSQDFVFFVADLNKKDLSFVGDLMEAGKVTAVIDRRYPLSEVPQAIAYLEEGHARGKVIITVE